MAYINLLDLTIVSVLFCLLFPFFVTGTLLNPHDPTEVQAEVGCFQVKNKI